MCIGVFVLYIKEWGQLMKNKTVGIILREWEANFKNLSIYGLKTDMIDYLRQYDINVICIPVEFSNKDEIENIKEIINFCDGIIFPGGNGVNDIDCEIMRYVYEKDKPTLGICLGMQIMGKSFNGKIKSGGAKHGHDNSEEYAHEVTIDKNSKLYSIIGDSNIEVNSKHVDCVEYTDLDCVASSEDNLIEAVEAKDKKFFIGVQWHPEMILNDENSNKLFDYYINEL